MANGRLKFRQREDFTELERVRYEIECAKHSEQIIFQLLGHPDARVDDGEPNLIFLIWDLFDQYPDRALHRELDCISHNIVEYLLQLCLVRLHENLLVDINPVKLEIQVFLLNYR